MTAQICETAIDIDELLCEAPAMLAQICLCRRASSTDQPLYNTLDDFIRSLGIGCKPAPLRAVEELPRRLRARLLQRV